MAFLDQMRGAAGAVKNNGQDVVLHKKVSLLDIDMFTGRHRGAVQQPPIPKHVLAHAEHPMNGNHRKAVRNERTHPPPYASTAGEEVGGGLLVLPSFGHERGVHVDPMYKNHMNPSVAEVTPRNGPNVSLAPGQSVAQISKDFEHPEMFSPMLPTEVVKKQGVHLNPLHGQHYGGHQEPPPKYEPQGEATGIMLPSFGIANSEHVDRRMGGRKSHTQQPHFSPAKDLDFGEAVVEKPGLHTDPLHKNHREGSYTQYGPGVQLPAPSAAPRMSAVSFKLVPEEFKGTSVDLPTEVLLEKGLHRNPMHNQHRGYNPAPWSSRVPLGEVGAHSSWGVEDQAARYQTSTQVGYAARMGGRSASMYSQGSAGSPSKAGRQARNSETSAGDRSPMPSWNGSVQA